MKAHLSALILVLIGLIALPAGAQEPAQARILPAYGQDGVSMIGIRLERIRPESLFAAIGLRSGDVILECNGIGISDPSTARAVLDQFATSPRLHLVVLDPSGGTREIDTAIPPE